MSNRLVCGIDFGTSNSVVSIAHTIKDAKVIQIDQTDTAPSAMFYPSVGTPPLFGRAATSAYQAGEEGRFMRSLKRVLGTSLMDEGTLIGSRRVPFNEIIGLFIRYLREQAEQQTDAPLTHVVAGRPVHFVDNAPDRDKTAEAQLELIFKNAGFKHILFQYEPVAAAFAHEIHLPAHDHLALVVDIGGGTSDFSVLKLSGTALSKIDRKDDILGHGGLRLGGNDFDRALSLQNFMPLLGMGTRWGDRGLTFPSYPFFDLSEWSKIPFMYTPKYKRDITTLARTAQDKRKINRLIHVIDHEKGHAVLGAVEDTKISLSTTQTFTPDLSVIEEKLELTVTRADMEHALIDSCQKLSTVMKECLIQSGLKGSQIDLVILTGGGTAIPIVQQTARTLCPNAILSTENMMASVGLGLVYDALRRFGPTNKD